MTTAVMNELQLERYFDNFNERRKRLEEMRAKLDTNGDGIADFVAGKIVVPVQPTAVENAAAADIAARVGFATTGLTPPVVIGQAEDRGQALVYVGFGGGPR